MSVKIKPLTASQKARLLSISIETAMVEMPKARVSEDHASQYVASHIQGEFPALDIVVSADRKLKKSAVSIRAKGDDVKIQISCIQVTYRTLKEALELTRKLLRAYDEKNIIVEFPSGNRKKGLSKKVYEAVKEYGISRYDAFDTERACGATHVCKSCGYTFTAVNCPNPDSPYQCPEKGCNGIMASSRLNYDYRKDNAGKHWSTLLPDQFKKSISIHSTAFRTFSLKDQLSILEKQGLKPEELPQGYLNSTDTLNVVVEEKATSWTEVKYAELKKLIFAWCKVNNHDRPKLLKRDKLIAFAKANGIQPK